jgi:transcriptional regulator with XRE-family HTH domain
MTTNAGNRKMNRAVRQIAQGDEADDDVGGQLTQPMDKWVAARVRLARLNRGWSLSTLAEHMGLKKRQRVEKWENGQNRLFAAQIAALARVLGVHPGWFFDDFPVAGQAPSDNRSEAMIALLDNPDVIPFVQLFIQIEDKGQRDAVMTMLRGMAAGSAMTANSRS